MHNAPSTTSTNKTPVPHALLLVQIWTNIFQWKSSLALHHNFQKCSWRAEHRSNEAETRNVPCSKKMSQSDNQRTILKIEMAWQCSQHNTDNTGLLDLEISMDAVFCSPLSFSKKGKRQSYSVTENAIVGRSKKWMRTIIGKQYARSRCSDKVHNTILTWMTWSSSGPILEKGWKVLYKAISKEASLYTNTKKCKN